VITIGDIHGFDTWKQALDYWRPEEEKTLIDQFDYIVFLGDYVDEFHLKDAQIYKNLLEIIELKKKYPEKVILLWGNHDIQYIFKGNECSGYRPSMYLQLNEIFTRHEKLFQLAFQIKNYIWTHAGLHRGWYMFNIEQQKYIIGLENPIEYKFKNEKSIIKQRQLSRDVKSYQQGISNCLVEDVDLAYFTENRKDFEDYILPILELASGNCLVILEMSAENSVRALENILNILFKTKSVKSSCHILADVLLAVVTQKIINDKNGDSVLVSDLLLNNQVVSSAIKQNKIYKTINNFSDGKVSGMGKEILSLFKKGIIDKNEVKRMRELNYK
jgi:hypothetical protein